MSKTTFLGKEGLTATSANHLANIAKEMYQALEATIESLRLYSRDFILAVTGQKYRVENESEKEIFSEISTDIKSIGNLKGFIAYLREAIKAKEQLGTDAAFEEHVKGLIAEGRTELKPVETAVPTTFEEEFGKLSGEQKAKYYALEAKCAELGTMIHPEGTVAKAREQFFEAMRNPTKVKGQGRESEISSYTSAYTAEEVDREFFSLQREYRTLQSEFNAMKSEIEEKVSAANRVACEKEKNALMVWQSARNAEREKYEAEIKALKIVIPQNLREIYEEVSKVANAR